MDKKINIRDYRDKKVEVTIKDFENVAKILVSVVTGDELLEIIYKDYNVVRFDSSADRMTDYFDDEYELSLDKVDEFSNFDGDSYSCADKFRKQED